MLESKYSPGGLGTATGRILRANGARLALLYAPFEKLRKDEVLENSYGKPENGDIKSYECDITSEASVTEAFQQIGNDVSDTAFPSILINAAGYVSVQPLEDTSAEEASKNLNNNLLGPILVSNAFAKLFWQNEEKIKASGIGNAAPPGRIVSISSQAAHAALDLHGAYCASKAGLMGLTRCMANEWGSRGITANTVSPTVAMTALGKKAWGDKERKDAFLKQIPVGRFAEPEEIGQAIAFLCRDESGMINGADIKVDGGFTIH